MATRWAPVEFHTREQIPAQFGPEGITAYALAYSSVGTRSPTTTQDDTVHRRRKGTLEVLEFLAGIHEGLSTHTGVTAKRYLRWLRTQAESAVR